MNPEILERIQFYVASTRRISAIAARNLHEAGHHTLAGERDNEVAYADLILKDLQGIALDAA
jgi:hypothetical protein